MSFRVFDTPMPIEAPGGKSIEEIAGRVNGGFHGFSLARMVAPPAWAEPAQTPEFGELTVMVRGRLRVEVGDETVEVLAPQAIWVDPRVRVRYSNPFADECEYYALCLPAFTPEAAHREGE